VDDLAFATHQVGATRHVTRLRLLHAVPRHGVAALTDDAGHHRASNSTQHHGTLKPQPSQQLPLCMARSHGGAQRFAAALVAHVKGNGQLNELELAFPLPTATLCSLGLALPRARHLRVVSLAGSRIGDGGLMRLLDGLQCCVSLQSLSVAACDLSDAGGTALAGLLREHTHARDYDVWRRSLRDYTGDGDGDADSRRGIGRPRLFERESQASSAAPAVPPPQHVGLLHLDVGNNSGITLTTIIALSASLDPRRYDTRLMALDARHCGLGVQAGDYLADVMRRGAALRVADCRGNAQGLAVIYRDDDGVGDVVHMTRLPGELGNEHGNSVSRRKPPPSFVQQPPMRFRLWSDVHTRNEAAAAPSANDDAAVLENSAAWLELLRPATRDAMKSSGRNAPRPWTAGSATPARDTSSPGWPRQQQRWRPGSSTSGGNNWQPIPPPPWLRSQVTAARPATAAPSQQQRVRRKAPTSNGDVAGLTEQLLAALMRLEELLPQHVDPQGRNAAAGVAASARASAAAARLQQRRVAAQSPTPLPGRPAALRREEDIVSRSSSDEEEHGEENGGGDGGEFSSGDEGGPPRDDVRRSRGGETPLEPSSGDDEDGGYGAAQVDGEEEWDLPQGSTPEALMQAVAAQLRVLCNLDDGI
jgi:hypothetical protein